MPDLTTLPSADARTHSQADRAARAGAGATAHRDAAIIAAALVVFGWLLWTISPPPDIRPPLLVDLAFDSFVPLRQAMLAQAANSAPILIGIGAAGLAIIWALALRGRRTKPAISASIALGCVLLALQAQVYVMRQQQDTGVALYLFAGAVFGGWLLFNRKTLDSETQGGLSRRAELILLTLVLAVTVFGRIYDLKRLPYGIDGDESKWTVEVVSVMVDGHDELASEYHRRYLPMSFWMQAPFHWIVGPGLTSARLGVAIFSVIASLVCYRLVREVSDAPTALVATLLLAVSLPDLTASRVGNVESHVKLWAILPFYGLAVALRTRAPRHFLLTGFAVAGAMLTYETLMPVVAATLTLALAAALRERREWTTWLRRLAMLATPPAVVAFVTIDYLLGRMQYYRDYRSEAEIYSFGEQLLRGIQGLFEPFFDRPAPDWLYYRDGPIINGLLVPLLALGIVYAIVHMRRRGSAIALTWLAWVFIPVPIILHSPLPRILYPGVPVLYVFIALALVAIYRAIVRATRLSRVIGTIGVISLGGLVTLNLTIWFQEVTDPFDELRRREIAEIAVATLEPDSPLVMPYVLPGETVDAERGLMALLIRERRHTTQAGELRAVLYGDLLPMLSHDVGAARQVAVLIDTTQDVLLAERLNIVNTLQRCYAFDRTTTTYFDLYTLTASDLAHPACRSARLNVVPPPVPIEGGTTTTIPIEWSLDSTAASQSDLRCWRAYPGILWIEAESFGDRVGWTTDARFVTDWLGDGYLADDRGSQYAATTVDVPHPGAYRLWVRAYRRQTDDFPALIAIDRQLFAVSADHLPPLIRVTGQLFPFGEADFGALNTWQWQPVADLTLESGPLVIGLTRPFDESRSRHIALFVDALALSADPNFDPRRDNRWQPALQMPGPHGEQTRGTFEAHLEPGYYRCEVVVGDGEKLVDETGALGITSDPIYISVTP